MQEIEEIQEEINVEQFNDTKFSKQSKSKYLPGMEDQGDIELENERKNLWKVFGRDTAAGKELFSLYKCYQPPKINYPKPKQKTKQQIEQEKIPKEKKECPQQTQIEYPPMSYKDEKQKYHPIDFVPKKKNEVEIKEEIEKYYRIPVVPANKGVNRSNLIEKLQIKMKNQRGGLPKGAELPMVNNAEEIDMTDDMKSQAVKRVNKKYKNFTNHPNMDDQSVTATTISQDPIVELNQLFDEIMAEIEERQKYLEDIKHLNEKDLNEKIKKEIIERVSELQKVTELRKFYKKKQ